MPINNNTTDTTVLKASLLGSMDQDGLQDDLSLAMDVKIVVVDEDGQILEVIDPEDGQSLEAPVDVIDNPMSGKDDGIVIVTPEDLPALLEYYDIDESKVPVQMPKVLCDSKEMTKAIKPPKESYENPPEILVGAMTCFSGEGIAPDVTGQGAQEFVYPLTSSCPPPATVGYEVASAVVTSGNPPIGSGNGIQGSSKLKFAVVPNSDGSSLVVGSSGETDGLMVSAKYALPAAGSQEDASTDSLQVVHDTASYENSEADSRISVSSQQLSDGPEILVGDKDEVGAGQEGVSVANVSIPTVAENQLDRVPKKDGLPPIVVPLEDGKNSLQTPANDGVDGDIATNPQQIAEANKDHVAMPGNPVGGERLASAEVGEGISRGQDDSDERVGESSGVSKDGGFGDGSPEHNENSDDGNERSQTAFA